MNRINKAHSYRIQLYRSRTQSQWVVSRFETDQIIFRFTLIPQLSLRINRMLINYGDEPIVLSHSEYNYITDKYTKKLDLNNVKHNDCFSNNFF